MSTETFTIESEYWFDAECIEQALNEYFGEKWDFHVKENHDAELSALRARVQELENELSDEEQSRLAAQAYQEQAETRVEALEAGIKQAQAQLDNPLETWEWSVIQSSKTLAAALKA